jgi:hypothetical protein
MTAFSRLARALGFGPPESPKRPEVRHPFGRLVFHNFAIYELYRGQPGRQYMALTNVEVVNKLSLREFETGQCEYRFELSTAVDAIWLGFFKRLLPDTNVRVENKTMVIVCFPSDLELAYEQTKDAVFGANIWHMEEREALLMKITAHNEAQQAMREMEENRKQGLQRQFDGLDL